MLQYQTWHLNMTLRSLYIDTTFSHHIFTPHFHTKHAIKAANVFNSVVLALISSHTTTTLTLYKKFSLHIVGFSHRQIYVQK